jgi:hypothetical protein
MLYFVFIRKPLLQRATRESGDLVMANPHERGSDPIESNPREMRFRREMDSAPSSCQIVVKNAAALIGDPIGWGNVGCGSPLLSTRAIRKRHK